MVVKVNKSSIKATRQSISEVKRANILKNNAPISPGTIRARNNWKSCNTILNLLQYLLILKYAIDIYNVTYELRTGKYRF